MAETGNILHLILFWHYTIIFNIDGIIHMERNITCSTVQRVEILSLC